MSIRLGDCLSEAEGRRGRGVLASVFETVDRGPAMMHSADFGLEPIAGLEVHHRAIPTGIKNRFRNEKTPCCNRCYSEGVFKMPKTGIEPARYCYH